MDDRKKDVPGREQELNIFEVLHVVARRKRLIMKICGGAAIISMVIALLLPNIYSAKAKVLPPQKESGGLAAMLGQGSGLSALAGLASGMGLGGTSDLYLAILKSRSVADAVIGRLDLASVLKTRTP